VNTIFEQLKKLPYFEDLPERLLLRVCIASEQLQAVPGEVIIEEGSKSDGLYVVTGGELEVTKFSGGRSISLARVGAGEVLGEISLLDDVPRIATVTAITDAEYIKVPSDTFVDLLEDPKLVLRMLRTVTSRLRETEGLVRSEERMAGLGRMAAGLMHELNNPMAAIRHGTNAGGAIIEDLGDTARRLSRKGVALPEETPTDPAHEELSALRRADAEDAMGEWLTGHGVKDGWELAPALLDAGWTEAALDLLAPDADPDTKADVLRWLGLRLLGIQVTSEVKMGTDRVSELIQAVKEFSYLDQGSIQTVDVRASVDNALILLKHRLKTGVKVVKEYDPDLPEIQAFGAELSQVWINLIDNAIYAMSGEGVLTITASRDRDGVMVTIGDTGSGIPDDVASRVFDPFFTTKEPGQGTGLGLPTVHSIVARHGGKLDFVTGPDGTTFRARLLLRLPAAAVGSDGVAESG
jgi:signal transduction histidine kinase